MVLVREKYRLRNWFVLKDPVKNKVPRIRCEEFLYMGPDRVDLWKIALGRNCEYLNTHNPVLQLCTLSNTDLQHVLTKHGVAQYSIKYT